MQQFTYFAYGSNMLTARLRERCPSATPVGCAFAHGHMLTFDKLGRDGSGKATIKAGSPEQYVGGVLFHIREDDLPALDRAEWGYIRQDSFSVLPAGRAVPLATVTYIAPPAICRNGLSPFDWYLELIRAGLREHGFSHDDTERLSHIAAVEDSDRGRSERMFGLCAMQS